MSASHDYAERLRARLPRTLQEEREAAGLSRYALEKKCGVSRERIGCIESGDSIPTLHPDTRLAHGMGMTLAAFPAPRGTRRFAAPPSLPPPLRRRNLNGTASSFEHTLEWLRACGLRGDP